MRYSRWPILACGLTLWAAESQGPAPPPDWPMAARNYASTRFSELTQINAGNVSALKPAWTFFTGGVRGHEAAPIVAEGMMFLVTPYPNNVFGFDLAHPGTPKWTYKPAQSPAAPGVACCDTVNRGAAYAKGRVFFNTLDNQTIALDARTGRELWKTRMGDINKGESMTMAPIVVKDTVLVGNSGGEFGVRGWLAGLDATTGRIVWRAYATGPDSEVLIGATFKPFYKDHRGKDLGVTTWPSEVWKIGGGAAWGWISYDPELDLIYYGTSNPGPWNPDQRPGDNKWTSTLFARRPDSGEAVWAYQISPHDHFDYDAVNENILVDREVQGRPRKLLLHPDRNGRMYVIDRINGQVLSAETYVFANTTRGIKLDTGRPVEAEEKKTGFGKTVRDICPAAPGGKDWQPSAYSPLTGLLYVPHNNLCMEWEGLRANYIAGTPYVGANVKYYAGPGSHRGEFTAWDPIAAKPAWKIKETFPVWCGALVTAGGLVFYGTMDRWFKAVDAKSGKLLWKFQTNSGIIGQPVTYQAPDGKQYVAILSGVGGWAGSVVSAGLDTRDGTGSNGFVQAMSDLPKHTPRGGILYVFALP